MEPVLVVTIAILVLLAGTARALSRQRSLPWSLPASRASAGAESMAAAVLDSDGAGQPPFDGIEKPVLVAPDAAARTSSTVGLPPRPMTRRSDLPEPVSLEVVPDPLEALSARLERFEARLEAIACTVERRGADLTAELHLARSDLALRVDAAQTCRDAAMERLRDDVLSALAAMTAERDPRMSARRTDVASELYARLARLEAALAAVTNPILLPGEAYTPPPDFLPEALVWENWNEVGERAFALADAYSEQRLHLSERTRADVGGFVTNLRTLLTRSVYPNLQPGPDASQQAALRAALEEIASELPRVRDSLEREYRDGRPA